MNARSATPEHVDAARVIASRNHVRLPASGRRAINHKEWFHFSVCTGPIDVLVNFSVIASPDATRPPTGRVTWLVRTDRWIGEVENCAPDRCALQGGEVAGRLDKAAFLFHEGAFHVSVRGVRHPVSIDMVLVPEALPALFHNIPLGEAAPLHWFVVPRLHARGTVRVGGVEHRINASAYHDHNWGRFRWGGDFAWMWGYAQEPGRAEPASLVFSRMTDRAGHATRRQGLFVWQGARPARILRGDRIEVRTEGLLRPTTVPCFPPVLGLRHGAGVTNVPRRILLRARDGADRIDLQIHPDHVCIVMVPAEGDTGVTRIHEVSGRFDVEGVVDGRPVAFSTRSVVELLRG